MPVLITTDVGCIGEAISKDGCIIIPHNDKKALADATIWVMNNKALARKIEERGWIDRISYLKELGISNKKDYLQKMKESWEMCMAGIDT